MKFQPGHVLEMTMTNSAKSLSCPCASSVLVFCKQAPLWLPVSCHCRQAATSPQNGNHLLRVRRTLLAHSLVAFRGDMEAEGKMYKPK